MKTSHVNKISSAYKSACLRTQIMRAGEGNRAPAISFFSKWKLQCLAEYDNRVIIYSFNKQNKDNKKHVVKHLAKSF